MSILLLIIEKKLKSKQFILLLLTFSILVLLILCGIRILNDNKNLLESRPSILLVGEKNDHLKNYLHKNNYMVSQKNSVKNPSVCIKKNKFDKIISFKNGKFTIYSKDNILENERLIDKLSLFNFEETQSVNKDINLKLSQSPINISMATTVFLLSFLIFFSINVFSNHLLVDTIQEKQSNLIDLINTSINPISYMLPKILSAIILIFIPIITLFFASFFILPDSILNIFYSYISSFNNIFKISIFILLYIICLMEFLLISTLGGVIIDNTKNSSFVSNLIIILCVLGFLLSNSMNLNPDQKFDIILNYIPLVSVFSFLPSFLNNHITILDIILIAISNVLQVIILTYVVSIFYKYGKHTNIDYFNFLFKKLTRSDKK